MNGTCEYTPYLVCSFENPWLGYYLAIAIVIMIAFGIVQGFAIVEERQRMPTARGKMLLVRNILSVLMFIFIPIGVGLIWPILIVLWIVGRYLDLSKEK